MCAHTYLFVWIETDTNPSMLHLWVFLQIYHRLHNLSNASLIVGTQQRMSVSHDEVFTPMQKQLGELLGRQFDTFAQLDFTPIVVLHDARFHVLSRAVGTCVHVRNEAHGRYLTLSVGRQRGIDISMFVHFHILQALCHQFCLQVFSKHQLLRRAGTPLSLLVRLRVELHIIQESLSYIHSSHVLF